MWMGGFKNGHYITAWIDKKIINENEIQELVIILLLIEENVKNARELLRYWLSEKLDKLNKLIEQIYSEQE